MFERHLRRLVRLGLAAVLAISAVALAAPTASADPLETTYATGPRGAVFTLSNASNGNEVLQFFRADNGLLFPVGNVSTGGLGTGAGLGNQGALVPSPDHRWLFAVNAGSDTIASLRVFGSHVRLVDVESSGGDQPISLTVHGHLLYVLNSGGDGSISGLRVGPFGRLFPINGSTRPLSGAGVGPAQISFNPSGKVLAVTEKGSNTISTYVVGANGTTTGPAAQPSSGMTPFGFAFGASGRVYVSEAFGGAAGQSAVSSYDVATDGTFSALSASVPDTQTAACWVVVTRDERFVYTTNTGSASVSSYSIAGDGSLSLLNAAAGATDATPIDVALGGGDRFLYTLNAGGHTISAFTVNADGSLSPMFGISGLPASANGLAAF